MSRVWEEELSTTEKKKSDLIPRVITAAIGAPILICIALFGPNWSLWVVLTVAAAISAWEMLSMLLAQRMRLDAILTIGAVIGTLATMYWSHDPAHTVIALFATLLLIPIAVLAFLPDIQEAAKRLTGCMTAWFYVAGCFAAYLLLVGDAPRDETGAHQAGWFLFPMFVVWAGDTGAYFTGRAFGRHKLAPVVSPKKTWEGAAGGLVSSVLGGLLCRAIFFTEMPILDVVVFSAPAAVLGQIGDLCESMIKRSTGVKDSGTILYGHGGILDRIDGLLFAVPWFFVARSFILS